MTAMPHDTSRVLVSVPTLRRNPRAQSRSREGLSQRILAMRPIANLGNRTFLLLVAAALAMSLVVMLALNTLMAKGSFQRYELMTQKSSLVIQEQALANELALLDTPSALAERADEMGMVMNPNPVFVDLRTGQLLGEPTIAESPDPTRDLGVDGDVTPTADGGGEVVVGLVPAATVPAEPAQ